MAHSNDIKANLFVREIRHLQKHLNALVATRSRIRRDRKVNDNSFCISHFHIWATLLQMALWHSWIVILIAVCRKWETTIFTVFVTDWSFTTIDSQRLQLILSLNFKFINKLPVATYIFKAQVINSHIAIHRRLSLQRFCTRTAFWRKLIYGYAAMLVIPSRIILTEILGLQQSTTSSQNPSFSYHILLCFLFHSPFLYIDASWMFVFPYALCETNLLLRHV